MPAPGARPTSAIERPWKQRLENDRRWTEPLRAFARKQGAVASDLVIVFARASEYPRSARAFACIDEWVAAVGTVRELSETALPIAYLASLDDAPRLARPSHAHAVICAGAPPFAVVRFRLPA